MVVRMGTAFLLDFLFLSIFFFPATYLYSGKWVMGPEEHLWGISDPICLVFLFIIFAYFIFMEALGFYLSAFLFFIAVTFILGSADLTARKAVMRVAIGFVFTGILFLLFKVLLAVQTPKGLLL